MTVTDMIFQYLYEVQNEALENDPDYQAARAERNAAEKSLVFSMAPKQRRMFHEYVEKANYMDALALRNLFSRCTFLLTGRER